LMYVFLTILQIVIGLGNTPDEMQQMYLFSCLFYGPCVVCVRVRFVWAKVLCWRACRLCAGENSLVEKGSCLHVFVSRHVHVPSLRPFDVLCYDPNLQCPWLAFVSKSYPNNRVCRLGSDSWPVQLA
jgi:hypothetical protein